MRVSAWPHRYIALAEDWLPISANWTNLMPMAVARNYGNLAEM